MQKHHNITQVRIANTVDRIRALIYNATAPLKVEACHLGGEPISFEEASRKNYEPFAIGDAWGRAWDTTWFRCSAIIPKEWQGQEVVGLVRLGYAAGEGFTVEGLVWQEGIPSRASQPGRYSPHEKGAGMRAV